ncbi:Uracil DNA glycosylase superfamily protein [Caloramator mitchellensis]|uniref:Type-4 uracil-DNA glycosylase n=1 Tax=Caloramator mitchellensis TaxID=908809 RepID=A0A0R3JU91_CALMK|nr:uracil-DNA glycosylase [Caloramator mitchellensis]KRQ85805.1 Uracil DNA glycosylase superfamily protein [Caloramator mitchellensis]
MEDKLIELNNLVMSCKKCRLGVKRTNVVFGEGNPNSKIMFIGEGPGEEEDRTGRPFVGKAGQLLTKMIEAINLKREDVYIANIVKCRPPNNRVPFDDEADICINYLRKQVAIIKPKIIVCLGATAARHIIDKNIRITKDRGNWVKKGDFLIMPTYHPSALLRDPSKKKEAWEDFKKIRDVKLI